MVGFLMFGRDVNDGKLWLYRFMIDRRHQGRGHGRAALNRLIDLIRQTTDWTEINVGYHPANIVAERLYLGAGFERAGIAPWGEQTARLDLAARATGAR
jgi:diamine N-acetyltransferase